MKVAICFLDENGNRRFIKMLGDTLCQQLTVGT